MMKSGLMNGAGRTAWPLAFHDPWPSARIRHITFTRIASTDTEIPNQPGSTFLHFDTFPSVDKEGEVAFGGSPSLRLEM